MYLNIPSNIFSHIGNVETAVIVIMVLFYRRVIYYWNNLYYLAFTNFIGTLFHELAHFCMALIFLKIPSSISLIPKKEGEYHNFGRVSMVIDKLNIINKFPISIAPIFLFPLILLNEESYIFYYKYFGNSLISNVALIYLMVVLTLNSFPSVSDIKDAFGPSMFLWIGIIAALYYQNIFDLVHGWNVIKESLSVVFKMFVN